MRQDRREFLGLGVGLAAAHLLGAGPGHERAPLAAPVQGIAFDGFPIIDPRPVASKAEALFPGKSGELMSAWRTRQFEYTWLRTLGGKYVDFWRVTEDALRFATHGLQLDLDADRRDQLMGTYLQLKAWPEVPGVIRKLKVAGLRMAFLSNFTAPMLDAALRNSGLADCFEPHLSTDRVKAFKPDPRAYRMGVEAFRLRRERIAFVASAAWDAAGAAWFGYPTLWINRLAQPEEELGVACAVGRDLNDLVDFVRP